MAKGPRAGRATPATYKVVEVSPVSDETLEGALNAWTREGWSFESLHFVTREGSHRPALAYLFFVGAGAPESASEDQGGEGSRTALPGGEGAPEPPRKHGDA